MSTCYWVTWMPSTVGIVARWQHPIRTLKPALWLDAADAATITASGGLVSQWDDKSGNLRHVTQGTAALQPTTGATTWNGRNVLNFNADYLRHPTAADWTFLHNGTVWTLLSVAQFGTVADPNALLALMGNNAGSTANRGVFFAFDDRAAQSRNDAITTSVTNAQAGQTPVALTANNTVTPNTRHLIAASYAPAATVLNDRVAVGIDGTVTTGNTANRVVSTSAPGLSLDVGAGGNAAFPLVGVIAEMVIIPRALTALEASRASAWLKDKWGTP